jgi:membrane-bound lytic murein transglycosylase MltF
MITIVFKIKQLATKSLSFLKFHFYNLRKKTRIGIGIGLLVMLIGIVICIRHSRQQIHDLAGILKSGRLTVLTENSSIGFSRIGGNVSGFQYEIIKAFADDLGVELVVSEQNDLKVSIDYLKNGDYDLIANLIPITMEWKKELLFSIPLLTSRQVLVQRISNDSIPKKLINNLLSLANDTIFISAHSPYKIRLTHLSDEIANPICIMEMNNLSTEQMVRLVATEKIKYTICDELFSRKLKLLYPNIDMSLPISFAQQQAWAVHPKSIQLLAKLNAFLSDFVGSSEYWDIYRKYY